MLALALLSLLAAAPPARPAPPPAKDSGEAKPASDAQAPSEAQPADDPKACHVYARRCNAKCLGAHEKALATCAKEMKAMYAAIKSPRKLSSCLNNCDHLGPADGCMGAPNRKSCDCQSSCYRALPAAVSDKVDAALGCYAKAVDPACH